MQVKESKEKEKLERRLLEELLKMFMDSESFYYSLTYDLTNSVQRQSAAGRDPRPLWQKVPLGAPGGVCLRAAYGLVRLYRKTNKVSEMFILYPFQVDDRFFWNKYMIQDLIEIGVSSCFLKYSKIIIVKQIF